MEERSSFECKFWTCTCHNLSLISRSHVKITLEEDPFVSKRVKPEWVKLEYSQCQIFFLHLQRWHLDQEWNWSSTWTFCVRGRWVPDQKSRWLLWHLGGRGRGLTSVERFRERNGQMALKLEGLPRHLGPWPLAFELFAGAMNSTFSRFTRWPICFVQCLVNDVNGIQDCFRKWEVERRRLLRGFWINAYQCYLHHSATWVMMQNSAPFSSEYAG